MSQGLGNGRLTGPMANTKPLQSQTHSTYFDGPAAEDGSTDKMSYLSRRSFTLMQVEPCSEYRVSFDDCLSCCLLRGEMLVLVHSTTHYHNQYFTTRVAKRQIAPNYHQQLNIPTPHTYESPQLSSSSGNPCQQRGIASETYATSHGQTVQRPLYWA